MSFLTGSAITDILLAILFMFYLLYWFVTNNDGYWEKRGIPYTKTGLIWTNFTGKKSQADAINDLYKQFAGEKYFGFFQLRQPILMVNDLELIHKVLVKEFTHFQDRGQPQNEKELLSKNLFHLKGQIWRAMRYKLTPTFSTGKLKGMFEQVSNCGENMVRKIEELSKKNIDVDSKDFLFEFTSEVISSCAFGLQFGPNSKEFNVFKSVVQKMFRPSYATIFKFILVILVPKLAKVLNFSLFVSKENSHYFLKLIKSTSQYRKENNIKRNDYLQLLLTLQEEEDKGQDMGLPTVEVNEDDAVIDQMKYTETNDQPLTTSTKLFTDEALAANSVIFLVAGSESTSNTISLALFKLACHPNIQLRLQQEVDSVLAVHGRWSYQALKEMTYLDQVIQEFTLSKTIIQFNNDNLFLEYNGTALNSFLPLRTSVRFTNQGIPMSCDTETQRFYPLLPLLMRQCTKQYKIPDSDLVIEKGVIIGIPVVGLQKDPQYYPDPEVFKPERFEGNNFKPNPTFLPFGDGPRICIAMRFAVMEMKTAIARILANYTIKLSSKTQLPLKLSNRSFVPQPEKGIWLNFEKRNL